MTTQVEEQAMTQSRSHAGAGAGAPAGSTQQREVPTWDEVVELHSARVYRLAYRLTGNRQDAEDLTQEVFVRVFRSLSSYTPGTFEGWLHRITTNLFLDGARRKAKIRFDALADDADTRIPSRTVTPDAAVLEGLFDDDVESALAALPPDFRAAVVLCDIEGLSYEEIADVLDLKLGTVRSRIHRGRTMLRKALAHRAPAGGRSRYSGPADQSSATRRRGSGLAVQPT
ncbi:MAG TPA: RNA polymerase sigma factor SigE [Nocardioides sp.]|uniref:RNA polymerase sigma factor SigE n=1 Tax=Nocardioides sp. TaxID=35761 RepID=UPI002D802741|nr:RNA polymerase sigma factor SigE [Nocardioides sp.]HET6652973.1 RNA polymerase sigma factor SigE [Nocardioides sp.]